MSAPHAGAARLAPLTIAGPAGSLEALIQERDAHDHAWAAVICHPHPLYGGTLHNKVVHRVASSLHRLGAAVLRFNFRGTGRSEGRHDHGVGEVEDARAALAFLRGRYPDARTILGGFSFGSGVASKLCASESGIDHLILVAPPVHTFDFRELETLATPKLVIQGTADDICPLSRLRERYGSWAEPKRLIEVAGASHFFDRQLAELAQAVEEVFAPLVGSSTSSRT